MQRFSQQSAEAIVALGTVVVKLPHDVYILQVDEPFAVETNEGLLTGNAGDYVAHDPTSGHVWPLAASYVAMHYAVKTVVPPVVDAAPIIPAEGAETL